jgi:hypothetical protein
MKAVECIEEGNIAEFVTKEVLINCISSYVCLNRAMTLALTLLLMFLRFS